MESDITDIREVISKLHSSEKIRSNDSKVIIYSTSERCIKHINCDKCSRSMIVCYTGKIIDLR